MDAADLILSQMKPQGRSLEYNPHYARIAEFLSQPREENPIQRVVERMLAGMPPRPELLEIEGIRFYLRHFSFKMSVRAWHQAAPYDLSSIAAAVLLIGVARDHLGEQDYFTSKDEALSMVIDPLCGVATEQILSRLWTLNNGIFPAYVFQEVDPAQLARVNLTTLAASVVRSRLAGLLKPGTRLLTHHIPRQKIAATK